MIKSTLAIKIQIIVGLISSVALFILLGSHSVGAISKQYFDNNDVSGSANIAGVVGKTPYVTEASLYVKAYFTSKTGNSITIEDYAFCPANTKYDDNGNSGSNGTNITKYTVAVPGKADNVKYGKKNTNCKQNLTIGVSFPAASQPNPYTGYYEATIDVDHITGGNVQNMFRISTNGVAVTHANKGTVKGSEVTVEQVDSSPTNINYAIRFGADCEVTAKKRAVISLFDLDNNGGSGAQLKGKVTVSLLANGSTRKIKVSDSASTSVSLSGSVNSAQPNGDGKRIYLHFNAYPGEKYVLRMNNVYHNNTIQYNTPFDGIFYQRDCQRWNVTPQTFVKLCSKTSWGVAGRTIKVPRGAGICFRQEAKNVSGGGAANTTGQRQRNWDASRVVANPGIFSVTGANLSINNLSINQTYATNSPSVTIPGSATTAPDGTKYCTRFRVNPGSRNGATGNGGAKVSTPACAEVQAAAASFDLTPSTSLDSVNYSYYPNINVTGTITPSGTPSGNHPWEIYAVRYTGAPSTYSLAGDSADSVCDKIPADDRVSGCESPIYSAVYPATSTNTVPYTSGGPDDAGTNICFFTRVQNADENMDGSWRYSDMSCAIAGVKPKVQVWGGDVKATGEIQTSLVDIQNRRFGSWGEYGVFSLGPNFAMGSGAGLNNSPDGRGQEFWSGLTFANRGLYGSYGGDLSTSDVNTAGVTAVGDLSLGDMSEILAPGQTRRTIVVNGTLTITSDLEYSNSASSIAKIPRVVLVADNIVIDESVTRIDPWLVSRSGSISTCAEKGFTSLSTPGLLDSDQCGKQLVFNGPVIAPRVFLYRTHDTVNGEPAEIFNLRASNILSSYTGSGTEDPVAITTSINEVSPRF